jgi:hypothetical protein
MAELQVDALDQTKQLPTAKRTKFIALRSSDVARRCTTQQWSDERRICVLAADDSESARVDCVAGLVATPAELVAMPPELRCELVANHVAALVSAPDGKFGMIAKHSGGKFDLKRVTEQMQDAQAAECDRIPWSLGVRRCIVASKTNQDMISCM